MIDEDVELGEGVRIFAPDLVNIFGCKIGDGSFVGPFVEITRGTTIGRNCIIESHAFLCDSVTLEDEVFIGHGAMFTNDLYPRCGQRVAYLETRVRRGASIGTNATIIAGIEIGEHAIVGAGAVITSDVPSCAIAAGNPARVLKQFGSRQELLDYTANRQPLAGTSS